MARLERRAGELRDAPLPLLDPDPAGRFRVVSAMPPEHYEAAVARAVERIRAGAFDKIVLAREVPGPRAARRTTSPALLGVLREAFPLVLRLRVGARRQTFIAATQELLVRRQGLRASTLALAG